MFAFHFKNNFHSSKIVFWKVFIYLVYIFENKNKIVSITKRKIWIRGDFWKTPQFSRKHIPRKSYDGEDFSFVQGRKWEYHGFSLLRNPRRKRNNYLRCLSDPKSVSKVLVAGYISPRKIGRSLWFTTEKGYQASRDP